MPKDFIDEEDNENLPIRGNHHHPRPRHGADASRVGVAGAIIGGAFNAGFMALILAVPSFNLPFITTAFAGVSLALLAGPAANIMSSFMQLGYSGRFNKHLGKLLESAAATWGLYSLWNYYPFNFSAVGLPPAVDKWLPIGFAVFAGFSAIAALTHFFRMFGPDRKNRRQREIEDDNQED